MRQPVSFAYGNCLLGAGGPWGLFALPSTSYATLSSERKQEVFGRLLAAIEAVEADIQVIRVARPWDLEAYAADLVDSYSGPHDAAHRRYVAEHRAGLADGVGQSMPAVYLAVSLEPPERDVGSYVSGLFDRSPRTLLAGLREWLALPDRRLLAGDELERMRARADEVHARLAGFLDVRVARTVEVQWLIRRAFSRGVGEPVVDGLHEPQALVFERNGQAVLAPLEADLLRWFDGYVENRGRRLRIESESGTSWQAQLVAGALPERAEFPSSRLELMFAAPESLPFGVDLTLNARYLPNDLALRLVRRRVQDADQILRAEADGDQGVTDLGYQRTQESRDLLAYLQSASHPPLMRATLAIAVAADSEAELERRVEACRRAYGEVRLHRPIGDQLELFLQHLPGQRTRVRGYDDVLTPEQVAAMMPLGTHAVGSRRGFYLGHTLGGSRQPVRFNLREGSDTDRNAAILSLGALGSGKTTLDQKLLYEGFLLGARIIDCDPKGDHQMHRLDDVAPHVETIALRPDRALRGMLDPLRVAPDHMRHDAAVSFLCDLLPARSDAAWETSVVTAVDAVVRGADEPTCFEVVRALSAGDEIDRQVAKTLAVYARAGLTQLGFADPDVRLSPVGGRQVTYIPIRDLPGPQPGTPRRDYSVAERVGEQIVRLIAMFAMQLMAAERNRLKLFSFDEGWRLLGDPVGRMLLASLQRMGRSELAVPIISTQLVSDTLLDGRDSLENLIGATFVFGLRSENEAARALSLLDLDPDDQPLRRSLLEFDAGRCLMRDHRGRVEAVQVDVVAPWLLRALSTTPPADSDESSR
ncbi:MAG TPA: ATP-binding protein [Solirubrobacteraceae bacterium]|nr:ATP-binding protein [Solirubrobacteraceae bacterium]